MTMTPPSLTSFPPFRPPTPLLQSISPSPSFHSHPPVLSFHSNPPSPILPLRPFRPPTPLLQSISPSPSFPPILLLRPFPHPPAPFSVSGFSTPLSSKVPPCHTTSHIRPTFASSHPYGYPSKHTSKAQNKQKYPLSRSLFISKSKKTTPIHPYIKDNS